MLLAFLCIMEKNVTRIDRDAKELLRSNTLHFQMKNITHYKTNSYLIICFYSIFILEPYTRTFIISSSLICLDTISYLRKLVLPVVRNYYLTICHARKLLGHGECFLTGWYNLQLSKRRAGNGLSSFFYCYVLVLMACHN